MSVVDTAELLRVCVSGSEEYACEKVDHCAGVTPEVQK